jgi:hypothetical protein
MHLEAKIMRIGRYTWRLGSTMFGDSLESHDRKRLDEYWEPGNLQSVVREGGTTGADIHSIA